MKDYDLDLDVPKVLEFLLKEKYLSEFDNIGGLMRHPSLGNFYDWLYQKGFIGTVKYFEICEELKKGED